MKNLKKVENNSARNMKMSDIFELNKKWDKEPLIANEDVSEVKDILKDMLSGVVSDKDMPKLFERLTEIGKVAIDKESGFESGFDLNKYIEIVGKLKKQKDKENPASKSYDDVKNNILKKTSLNIKDVLSGLISEDDMPKLLETITEVQKIELEKDLKKQKVNNESHVEKNETAANIFNYDYEPKNKNEIKAKNIILNIDVSKIDSLTINIL